MNDIWEDTHIECWSHLILPFLYYINFQGDIHFVWIYSSIVYSVDPI